MANLRDDNGFVALYVAVGGGHVEVASLLMGAHCDLNLKDRDGDTALHRACWQGRSKIASLLIEAGADIHLKNEYGTTPLDLAGRPQVRSLFRPKFKALIEPSLPKSWKFQTETIGDIIVSFICG